MATDLIIIPRIYLKPKAFHKSGFHTHYSGSIATPGQPIWERPLTTIQYMLGVAYGVPKNIYDAAVADGIATTDRPRIRDDDDER